ncbi:hypothetical protein [Bradyrhizobium sp. ARR65]|uniref:hypothetical protein n=1 Tax=Bradyrhizobium sp. ARR65 TaxID=1040989 RepID=UPI00055789EE|nr:hypothetical protein [Bradyrhizobium sp. ARR65]
MAGVLTRSIKKHQKTEKSASRMNCNRRITKGRKPFTSGYSLLAFTPDLTRAKPYKYGHRIRRDHDKTIAIVTGSSAAAPPPSGQLRKRDIACS